MSEKVDVLAVMDAHIAGLKASADFYVANPTFPERLKEAKSARAAVAELIAAHRQLLEAFDYASDQIEEVTVDKKRVSSYDVYMRSDGALKACGVTP